MQEYVELETISTRPHYTDDKVFKIAIFADWHWGAPTCKEHGVIDYIERVKAEGMHWIGMGDLIENSTKNSVGDVYTQKSNPMIQIREVSEMLAPIKDKCLAFTEGNHEYRTFKEAGISAGRYLAERIGVDDRFWPDCFDVGIIQKQKKHGNGTTLWKIFGHHGHGGARMPGTKLTAAMRLRNISINSDIYLCAHSHARAEADTRPYVQEYNQKTGRLVRKPLDQTFYVCGAALEYGMYGARKLMEPPALKQIILNLQIKRIRKTINGKRFDFYIKQPDRELVYL